MREYEQAGAVEVGPDEDVASTLWQVLDAELDEPAVAVPDGDGFETWSRRRFAEEVAATARGLVAIGVEPGQRVAIYAPTRVEWSIVDLAIWSVGAVTVPIYDTSSADQIEWIVSDSGAVAIVIGSEDQADEYRTVADQLGACEHAYVLDEGGLGGLQRTGEDGDDHEVRRRTAALRGDDLATIVYTSGTTGRPKGCRLTHHNLVWTVTQTRSVLGDVLRPDTSTLLFLPLAHIFSRLIQVVCLQSGVVLGFSRGLDHLQDELRTFRPTFLLAVPRVFEKVLDGARQQAHDDHKGPVFDQAVEVAESYSRDRATGSVGLATRLQHILYERLVYAKLRDAMGGRVQYAVSGGSPLGARLGHVFDGMGITILEGYGLTETTAPVTLNRPDALRIGTVGRPLPGVTVRIADDGEILVRGGNVFEGYHENPEATDEVLGDWYRTEDLGELDDDGYLTVTGRKKELIVTASGKNVSPGVVEERLRSHTLVGQAVLVGDGRPFVGALLDLDPDELERWAERHERSGTSIDDLVDDDDLHEELRRAVDEANDAVSRAEQVREFRVLPDHLRVEDGELTPTLKVKREVVEDRYGSLIEDIYDDES